MKNSRVQKVCYARSPLKKTFFITKLTSLLIFVSFMQISAKGYSEAVKLDLNVENLTILEVFEEIEDNTTYRFFYDNDLEDLSKKVTINAKQKEVSTVLKELLDGTDLTYEVKDKLILVQSKNAKAKSDKSYLQSATQQKSISGKVIDENGATLPGVTVVIKGTSKGTITNIDGEYTIQDVPEGSVLEFSFIGLKTQEIEVGNQTAIDITLTADNVGLDEVIVIGYGTQKKVNLTSAVQTVDIQDLENRPVKGVTEMLSASVPGLNITTTSGAPDAESSLNIRGFTGFNSNGAPLVLVDGVPQDIDLVNANDVGSISVLKDAAASAIYGSRAPNGVILITTKSGKKGQKMQINFSADMIVSSPLGLPNAADSDVASSFRNDRRYNTLRSPLFSEEAIERMTQYINGEITTTNIILDSGLYGSVYEYNGNTDHYDSAFRDNVFNQKYNVSINGGSEKTTYYASIGYIENDGVYDSPVDWMKRYSALIKVDTDVTDWLSVGISSKYGREQSERPNIWNNGQNDGKLFDSAAFMTSLPDYDDNGSPNEFSIVPNLSGAAGSYNSTIDDLWLTGQFNFKPVKGLSIKGDYSWNVNHQFDNNTQLVFTSWDADGTLKPSRRSPSVDTVEKESRSTNYNNLNLIATYNLNVAKHDLTLLVGYNKELNQFNSLTGSNTLLYTQSVPSLSTTYSDSPTLDDTIYSWATKGYFGRVSYNYKETYLLDVNMRRDASSKYSSDTRWAFFPSVSAGYNIAKEKYWPLKEHVNMFKLKGSWGKLGNNTGSNYAYLPTMGTSSQTPVILDGGQLPYVTMPSIVSDDLTWTKPRTIGFGVETASFNNRLKIDYDWFQRTVFDQQGPAQQYSEVLGTTGPKKNNAISETRGWEITMSWNDKALDLNGSPLKYGVRVGLSDYIGYVVEYESNETGTRSSWTAGQVFGELYGWTSAGIAQSAEEFQTTPLWRDSWFYPGDLLFEDTNGDGLINNGQGSYWYSQGDRKLLGYTYPRYKYQVALNASWKGFSLSALFDGVGKQTVYTRRKFVMITKNFYTEEQDERGAWSLDNQDAFYPRAYDYNLNQTFERYTNDQYAMNLAHLRIKNVNLSYQVPTSVVSKLNLRSLGVSVSGENLGFVYYKAWAKEYDPIQYEQDFQTYPPSRILSVGLKMGI